MTKGALFSLGYGLIPHPSLIKTIVCGLDATLVDVRFIRGRAKRGFGCAQIEAMLGPRYEWRGNKLGGAVGGNRGPTAAGLERLAQDIEAGRRLVIMCACDTPEGCHRHRDERPGVKSSIGAALLSRKAGPIDAQHIYYEADEPLWCVTASELERVLREKRRTGQDGLFDPAAITTLASHFVARKAAA